MKTPTPYISFGIACAALFILNVLVSRVAWRWDLTEEKRYTLDAITRKTLAELDDVVTIKAYFSEELPSELLQARQNLVEQLSEYERAASGQLVYAFINPNTDAASEQEAQKNGITPLAINIQKRDEVKQTRAYMGLTLEAQGNRELIAYLQPNSPLEYQLTAAITKLTRRQKPPLALIQGHGEPRIAQLQQLQNKLSVLYTLVPFHIQDSARLSARYAATLWLNPQDTIAKSDLAKVHRYLEKGGGIFIAHNQLSFENPPSGAPRLSKRTPTGLSPWLAQFNLYLTPFALADARCGQIQIQQQQGFFVFNQAVRFPYFPLVYDFADHPITQGLEVLSFQFAQGVSLVSSDSLHEATPLLFTSNQSAEVNLPLYIDATRQWTESDFNRGAQSLAYSLVGGSLPHPNARLVLTTGPPFTNEPAQNSTQPQVQHEDNINFIAGAVDWLADDTGLVNLRTKNITSRPIKELEDGKKNLMRYANLLAPIMLILLYGLFRKQRALALRRRWMQ